MSSGASKAATGGSGAATSGGTQQQQPSGNQGGRNRSKGGGSGPRRTESSPKPATKKFVGKEEGLGDEFVYQVTSGSDASDQFAKTTEEIIRFTATKYKNGGDVERTLTDEALMVIPLPTMPVAGADGTMPEGLMMIWKMEAGMVLTRRQLLETNLTTAYALIQGQCSDAVLEKVRAQADFVGVHRDRDPVRLLGLIRSVMYQYDSRKHRAVAIIELTNNMVSQTRHMSDSEYLEKFRTRLSVIESAGGTINVHHGLVDDELEKAGLTRVHATVAQMSAMQALARNRWEAVSFLLRSDQHRYGKLIQELANDYNKGRDCYPDSLTEAYELMLHDDRGHDNRAPAHGHPGVSFNTVGDPGATGPVTGTKAQPNTRPDITCNRCSRTGHFANKCAEVKALDGTVLATEAVAVDAAAAPAVADSAAVGAAHTTVRFDEGDRYGFQFLNDGEVQKLNDGVLHSQHKAATGQPVPSTWILLDNQSTVDVFCNGALLRNIRESGTSCRISCNAGMVTTELVGDLDGYPNPVWYHPGGIANILSLHRVGQTCRIRYDNHKDGAVFRITKPDGSVRDFRPSITGLHYCDTGEHHGISMTVATVADNKNKYTVRAYRQAVLARRIQDTIGRPSTRDYVKIVEGGMLQNCPVSRQDIVAAEDIFGPNLGSLKGKTVRHKNDRVESLVADVPYDIIKVHKDVTLCFDIMFVNKIAFLVTVSRSLRFGTTERLATRRVDVVGKALASVIALYRKRGFRVRECHGDGEFESLRADLADVGAQLNVTAEDEHVPEAERYVRTLKERARATYNTVPFKKMPGIMIVELVHAANYWLNMFPANDGVSSTLSPRRIMTGQHCDYALHGQLQFGEYAQVHESHDNSMSSRTTGAIALRPTGNAQGGYYFLSLSTGKRLNRFAWTPLPMPGEVIDRVHELAGRNPAGEDVVFGWRDGTEIIDVDGDEDDLYDEDYDPSDDEDDSTEGDASDGYDSSDDSDGDGPPNAGVDIDESAQSNYDGDDTDDETADGADDTSGAPSDDGGTDDADDGDDTDDQVPPSDDGGADGLPTDDGGHPDNDDDPDEDEAPDELEVAPEGVAPEGVAPEGVGPEGVADAMDKKYGVRQRSGLRTRKPPRSPSRAKVPQSAAHHALNSLIAHELGSMPGLSGHEQVVLTQYSLKRGLETYGQVAVDAVVKELTQLHDRRTIHPRFAADLSMSEKRKALAYLMFVKEKRCGTIKARGCADGDKQRLYKTKAETSSPTVRTESLLLSCVIDAKERRKVVTCDVPGAFMQVDIDEVVHIRLEGALAELLTKVDPALYTKYLVKEKGKTVMYVQLDKALYGTLSASMLFWKDLSGHLLRDGFVPNPYDSCVMNKIVNGAQCTVLWHVDDLKISHVDISVCEKVVDLLNERYGKETPVTVTRGDLHDYLGMTLDFSTDGQVSIRMQDYVENMVADLPASFDGTALTPAAEHLFKVNDKAEKLDDDDSDLFHSTTAKILFLCKRARPEVQTAVAFLCTRVKSPDVDDMKKLQRLVRYLRDSKELCLTLEADDLQIVKWWVDASFAVHQDMRSHTGGTMSLGKGAVYSVSTRQKLNTKSSTEAELVGVDDVMPMLLWTRQFMEGQGYVIKDNILYQDNQSSILLEKNGQQSSTKRTRHLDIRYFFVTDRVRAGQLTIEYCPTGDMWADIHTKPLQGAAFAKFRKLILNLRDG
jgi:Reverse transcriptase (RNA-dependent DNA polymerase)